MSIRFTVNGIAQEITDARGEDRLIDYLHGDLNLTGTKFCCGMGICRACTVAVAKFPNPSGSPVVSCSTAFATLAGSEITTIDGVSSGRRSAAGTTGLSAQFCLPVRLLHARFCHGRQDFSRPTGRGPRCQRPISTPQSSAHRMMVSVMCRQKVIQDPASLDYDEIAVIAHNPRTGATCWFQASGSRDKRVSGKNAPSPTSAVDDSFWNLPETVAADGCGNCHDNDAFMYSPFVGQVLAEVPAAPFGPYFQFGATFGFDVGPTETFALGDNTCTSCHRIGIERTCRSLTQRMTGQAVPEGSNALAKMLPLSHAMPPAFGQRLVGRRSTATRFSRSARVALIPIRPPAAVFPSRKALNEEQRRVPSVVAVSVA